MGISWLGDLCIVCLDREPLTLEHVIPDSLGGKLTCEFLCKDCNDFFGQTTDKAAKNNPNFRKSVLLLQDTIPKLAAKIEAGQRYLIKTDVTTLPGLKCGNTVVGTWTNMPDGSKIAPESDAIKSLIGRMRSEGLSDKQISESLSRYEVAEPGETVSMSSKWKAKKLASYDVGPDFHCQELDPLLFVKIAYEFSALLVGRGIYNESNQLCEIRSVLRKLERGSSAFSVENLSASKSSAFHGIAFEGNLPCATFQIRIFGKHAFRVQLKNLAINQKPTTYTHNLETGEQWYHLPDEA